MDPIKDIQARLQAAIKRAQELMAKPERTAEETAALDQALDEGNALKAQLDRAKDLEALKTFAATPDGKDVPLVPPGAGEPPRVTEVTAPEDRPFESFGAFLKAVHLAGLPGGKVDVRLSTKAATGASEGVPSDGGFLVSTDFASELLRRTYDTGVLTPKTRRIPIGANSNGVKINAVAETSRADGSRWGGVVTYWVDEAGALTASRPKFRQMELSLHKLTGLYYATDELLADTAALEATANMAFSEEFAYRLDDALIRGTGAGQPLGILNAPCLISVTKETGQAAATIVWENIKAMWGRLWARSRANAVWYVGQDLETELMAMTMPIGTGGVPVYLPPGGLAQAPLGTLLGRPVQPIEQAAALGTQGDIILADYSQYLMIEKGGMQAASSIHVRFLNDESVFRFTLRTDGMPSWNSPLTPANGGPTQGPFVVLDTRA